MAIDIVNASSQTFLSFYEPPSSSTVDIPQIGELPICLAIRFKPTANDIASLNRALLGLWNDPFGFGGYDKLYLGLEAQSTSAKRFFASASRTSPAFESYSADSWYDDGAVDTWQSGGGMFEGTVDSLTVTAVHNGVLAAPVSGGFSWMRDFENVYLFTGSTAGVGAFAGGAFGCWQDACIWVGTALTADEWAAFHNGDSPDTIQPQYLRRWLKGVDLASVAEAYAWDGAAVTRTTDFYVSTGAGTIDTCEDEFPISEGGGDTEEGAEDVDDVRGPCDVDWDPCGLIPQAIRVEVVTPSVSPGRSLSSREQIVQAEAGFWKIVYENVPVRNKAEALLWREIESKVNGRAGVICVPVYEAPLSSVAVAATLSGAAVAGAVRLGIAQTAGTAIRAGQHFTAGDRLYRIKSVLGIALGVTSVKVWPPLREGSPTRTMLDFNTPSCRCRLATDGEMQPDARTSAVRQKDASFSWRTFDG
jgi:hypothetical protein